MIDCVLLVQLVRNVQEEHARDAAHDHAHEVGQHRKQNEAECCGDHARHNQETDWVERHRFKRLNLLAHNHGSKFRRNAGAGETSEHNGGDQRTKFTKHRHRDQVGHFVNLTKGGKTWRSLQSQNNSNAT